MSPVISPSLRILVAGGGIGGLSTALACARAGFAVHVLERAPEIGEVGAGLQVGPNAGRLLDRLGVLDEGNHQAVFPHRAVMLDLRSGDEITSVDFGPEFVEHFGAPYAVMHRGDLLTALFRACVETGLVTVESGKELVDLVQDERSVSVRCADGSAYRADLLVGADGLRSRVRAILHGDEAPATSQYVIYRGAGPRPEGVEDAVKLWVGDRRHYMQYPVRSGTILNRVISFESLRGVPGSDDWGTPAELRERFSDACDYVRSTVELLETDHRWLQYDRPPRAGWTQGRITLMGDAAHAMRQYLSQGACQALEDAVELAECLSANSKDAPLALKAYEARRYPRASAAQRNSRYLGELCHLGGVAATVRDALLSSMKPNDYRYLEWLYARSPGPPPVAPDHLGLYPEPTV